MISKCHVIACLGIWIASCPNGHSGDSLPRAPADTKEAAGRAAIIGYSANVDSFPFYRCRYRITQAEAKSIGDALQGKIINARSYDNLLTVNRPRVRYQGFAPKPDFSKPERLPGGEVRVLAFGHSGGYLSNGKNELAYEPGLQTLHVSSDDMEPIDLTPFGPGHPLRGKQRPDAMLRDGKRYVPKWLGHEDFDGRAVITVSFDDMEEQQLGRTSFSFAFDPTRGHSLVRRIRYLNGSETEHAVLTHIRECANGRWFPERCVYAALPTRPGDNVYLLEVRVLELECDNPPKDEEFTVRIPAGTAVAAPRFVESRFFFRLKQDEEIGLNDLSKLLEMVQRVRDQPRMDTAIPRTNPYKWYGVAGGGVVAIGGLGFLVYRRWRSRTVVV
jgi:hypothetical protein